ncbi:MAG: hypothetical protein AB7I41_03165 [Candidatus Sericytochromatia bacterium]
MPLKQFEVLQEQAQQVKTSRHKQGQDVYQQAMAYFQQAAKSEFQDKAALKQSVQLLHQTLHLTRDDHRPHLVLGYILYLMDQPTEAAVYAHQAQKLHPEDQRTRQLLGLLKPSSPQIFAVQASSHHTDLDFDALYDQVESQIQEKSQHILSVHYHHLKPSQDPEIIRQLEHIHKALSQFIQQTEAKLSILEEEFELSELKNSLRPLQMRLKQWHNWLRLSEQMLALEAQIQAEIQSVRQWTEQARKGAPISEQTLDVLFDRCDRLADRLDALEAEGIEINALLDLYQRLVKKTDALQDALDETAVAA